MLKHSLVTFIAGALLGTSAAVAGHPNYEPIYITDGQYDAALKQGERVWRLLPLWGDEVDVTDKAKGCNNGVSMPHGLWYVTQDDTGRPLLLAPSVTSLPPGFPEQVALRACGEAADVGTALFVPAVAFEWISEHAGTVLIDE
jgi:hypothetical protein